MDRYEDFERTLDPHRADEQAAVAARSEEHTSELQSRLHLVCRLLLEKKKKGVKSGTVKPPFHHSTHRIVSVDSPPSARPAWRPTHRRHVVPEEFASQSRHSGRQMSVH